MKKQRILMCAPDHFGVDYVINPWMEHNKGQTDASLSRQQWGRLHEALAQQAEVVLMPPQPHLPDLVFTANAGLVWKDIAVVSRFASKERQGEEPFDRAFFQEQGFKVADWPQEVSFEGAGDSLFHRGDEILWQGYGFRSDKKSVELLSGILGVRVIGIHLVDPRFYHLDTCFCPLPNGYVMYFPAAFDATSRHAIENQVAPDKRIVVEEGDAVKFACNAVELNGHVFVNGASAKLSDDLKAAGFTVQQTSLSEYMKSGGAAKCLTLKLVEPET
jgi:N-dimethylarginine dimethylaminohydrolase